VISDLQTVAVRYQDTVALYVVLGGGWWTRSEGSTPAADPAGSE
jgi:hypothetical protein